MAESIDPGVTAAELALGLLEGEARAAALRRTLAEPDFAREVEAWQSRLAPIGDAVAGVSPPDGLWPRIEAALDRHIDGGGSLILKLRRWRAIAALSSAVAASLALALVLRPAAMPPVPAAETPVLVAQLGPSDAQAVLLASYNQSNAELSIAPAIIDPKGHSPELWVIPEGDKPHSLGLVGANGTTRIIIPVALRAAMHRGATIAVSLEPQGGSPTGQPTGPIVAVGKFTKI